MNSPTDILVILDGDLPSVVGAAIARDELLGSQGHRGTAVIAPGSGSAAPFRRSAALDTAEAFGFQVLLTQGPDESQNQLLLRTVEVARAQRIARISWPIHAGGSGMVDLDKAARLVHRAHLAARLVQLAHADPQPVTIRADLVDLADEQIADLALDVDAPARLTWWWDDVLVARVMSDRVPAEAALNAGSRMKVSQIRRWLPILMDAGVDLSLPQPTAKNG